MLVCNSRSSKSSRRCACSAGSRGCRCCRTRESAPAGLRWLRRISQIGARGDQRVLGLRDARGDRVGLVLVVGEVQLLDDRLDEVPGIGRIVDRKVRRKADPLGVGAQDAGEDRVEGTHPNMASLTLGQMFWNHFDNTLTHLLRCFIRKCRCQNIFGFDSFLDHIGDARGEHARLARPAPAMMSDAES